jgi:3-oxoacyl-[acyl-carrier-protein] synthase-3
MNINGRRAGITGVGVCVPERIVTNVDLESLVDTNDQWIRERTGIAERRFVYPEQATSDLAVVAGERALVAAGVDPEQVDLIIVATNTPDMLFPATACLVQDRLGASRAGAFDLLAGCTGFVYALTVGAQFVVSGAYKTVLVIGSEVISKILDFEDRNTCVLFGDGAGAAVLQAVPGDRGILAARLGSDGSGGLFIHQPGGGSRIPASHESLEQRLHYLKMNGREVFKFAVRVVGKVAAEVLDDAGLKQEELDFFIPHQANIRIIEVAAKRLGLPMDRVLVNVDRYGNTSTASVPLALNEALEQGRIKDGDNVVMVGFGTGLTWAAVAMKWYSP